ncbi:MULTISPECIES: ABC transporter substrate-binding protein [unclassified Rhizobium]|uniref:ABC transporter substrate-binding protein n=1 Tax=unclassified Rhizobium TaxID=2613769 RepID=UPI0010512986|nr:MULTISPECIES: ABC transporter substrate-binding protein [unclassified Rhizobium]MBB3398510.1 sulfonate transport system substrate-binding protein [Rhizobium sp. BK060]MBB4171323.1 sulfonate transport system substrate-binding protein [Rhizobium sp. BK538]TCM74988.1 sulfonate transport system substrate-binding protein [Rhizobium sp. BK068]
MKRAFLSRVAAGLALMLTASATVRAEEPLVIHVGYAAIGVDNRPYAEGTSAATARAGEFLEKEFAKDPNIKIEWTFFKGAGPAVNEGFANDQLDFAYQGDLPSLIGRANGLKTKYLLASGARKPLYLAVAKDSGIKSIADLKGRKIALQRGTNGHLAAVKVLEAHGLKERDAQVVNLDSAGTVAALTSKDIDAAFGDTQLINLAAKGAADVIYTTKGDDPRFGRNAGVIGRQAFIDAHPEITQRVVDAFVKAAQWSSDEPNRPALLELWHKSGTPVPILEEYFKGDTLAYRNSPLIDGLLVSQYKEQAAKSKEFGLIRRDVDLESWFEPRYLNSAIERFSLQNFWQAYGADGKPVTS